MNPTHPHPLPNSRYLVIAVVLSVILGLLLFHGLRSSQPVALPEVGSPALPCLSYAPFRRPGATPFDEQLHVPVSDIEADLRLLSGVTRCVRLYGVDHGLDAVPAVARRLGLRVILGAWIGRDPLANESQLARALALAHAHRDVIDMLVVGNEVLLRRELPPEALAALLARARRESPVPVSYADVWAFWLQHAETLRPHVDVVAAHVLPYWEDEPVGIDHAVDHVLGMMAQLRQTFGNTPVYLAETGWPAAGRQRGPAVPGRLEQARFVRELLARQPQPFNLIEAFDQPWKRRHEGAMGGAWGLFDAAGIQRVPLIGPVIPDPQGMMLPAGAALGALLLVLLRRGRKAENLPILALGGGLAGALAALQLQELPVWSRDAGEWAANAFRLGASLLCGLAASVRLAGIVGKAPCAARCGVLPFPLDWKPFPLLALSQAALLAVALFDALWLVFDARYRPLPWALLATPALLLLALAWLGDRLPSSARAERLLAAAALPCAVMIVHFEGWANTQALLYAGCLAMLACATLWPPRPAHH